MTRMTLSLFAATRATSGIGQRSAGHADASTIAADDTLERRSGLTPIELAALEASASQGPAAHPA